MSLAEVEAVRAQLSARPAGLPIAARRAGFEAMMARASIVEGSVSRPVELSPGLSGAIVTTPGADPSRLLVWLHGGQFALGSSASYRSFASRVSAAAGIAVLVPDYRLAPEHQFPAAHDDADVALDWAMTNAAKVAIGGDSAGANLAVAAVQAQGGRRVAAAWLLSPYLDLTHTAPSIAMRAPVDPFVDPAEMDAVAARYLGTTAPADPRASPLFGSVTGFPPAIIQVGSDEALFDDADRFARLLPDVVFQQWEGMIHVWPLFADSIEEGRWAIAQAGSFLRRQLFQA